MNPVEAWAILDREGRVMEIAVDYGNGYPTVRVCARDAFDPAGAPHHAVKGEWRAHNDVAR